MSSAKKSKLNVPRMSIEFGENPLTDSFLERWKKAPKAERQAFIRAAIARDKERSAVTWGLGINPAEKPPSV